ITFQVPGDGRAKESHPAFCPDIPQVHGPGSSAFETKRLAARIDELAVIAFQVPGDGRAKESHPAFCPDIPQVHGPGSGAFETKRLIVRRLSARIDELAVIAFQVPGDG